MNGVYVFVIIKMFTIPSLHSPSKIQDDAAPNLSEDTRKRCAAFAAHLFLPHVSVKPQLDRFLEGTPGLSSLCLGPFHKVKIA
jgi:hypothetical protein